MGFATYSAKRGLAPGHAENTSYTIPLTLTQDGFEFIGKDLKETQKSLSGVVEVLYFGSEKIWSVTLEPVSDEESLLLREFIGSTADGQAFTFDPYGSEASPSSRVMTAKRNDDGAKETVFLRTGDPGGTDSFQFSFEVREAG
jgi:hypothetical protein